MSADIYIHSKRMHTKRSECKIKLNKGVNYLIHLRNEYNKELTSKHSCQMACPIVDVRNTFKQECDDIRDKISHLSSKISEHHDAHMELARYSDLEKFGHCLDNDKKMMYDICEKKIIDIEMYNLQIFTRDLILLASQEVLNRVTVKCIANNDVNNVMINVMRKFIIHTMDNALQIDKY